MVSGPRTDSGTLPYSPGVRKTIQSIKEIVGDHSDADIYVTLKETNMDPNETAQKLLNQDPFHEVKRKRDKKKETNQIPVHMSAVEPRKQPERVAQGVKFRSFSDRNVRRRGYSRNALPDAGVSREFRVVRDNRVNQNANRDTKPASVQSPTSANEQVNFEKSSSTGTSRSQYHSSRSSNRPTDSHRRNPQLVNSIKTGGRVVSEETQTTAPTIMSRVQTAKPNDHQSNPAIVSPSGSVVGLYSSSSDPVHVPSPSATVGAIRREVGAVGVRRQSSENSVKNHSVPANSLSNSLLGRDGSSAETFRPFTAISKNNQLSQPNVTEPVVATMSDRTFLGNNHQYGSRVHQQPAGHQKANQPNKEWKPKSSQKPSLNNPGVIGTPAKSVSPPADNSEDLKSQLQEKLSRVSIYENQNVIIAQHIRVPESDRCRLTFGSFGVDFDSSRNSRSMFQAVETAEQSSQEPSASSSVSPPESSSDNNTRNKQLDLLDDQVRTSESSSPASDAISETQSSDKKDSSSSPQNLENYADIGLVRDTNPTYPAESQQHQDPRDLPTFPAYDPQTGYDIPYFRPMMDEAVRGHGLPSPQEVLTSHSPNIIPPTTIAMIQQQQQQQQQPQPVTPLYPPVHVSHFTNLMPYRQFISPVYVPPMAMTGYSGNPAYPHPSNASSYLLMPGGSSHLTASTLKYGIQQFKPVPTGSPTGFGNFANPTGYAINAPGGVGNATGLEDSSRLKYKDGNLYVPNQQAETSEIWIQNPRELPGLQSTPYYNMAGQAPPHAAYLQSHTGHASFNAATAQSSHMQFPSMYHPQQPPTIASPHHMGPAMGGNVGVAGAAPGSQIGAYQQPPQLGHLSWPTNF